MVTAALLFLFVILIQSVFLVIYGIGIFWYRAPKNENPRAVSIIVAARNEYQNLIKLVPLLLEQDHPDFEVIIVNDGSEDRTEEYLSPLSRHQALKVIHISECPPDINRKKNALLHGIEAAKNDVLLLTDADCVPVSNQWAKTMSFACSSNVKIITGVSTYTKDKGFLNRFIRYETLLTALQYLGLGSIGRPYMGVGRNLLYKKSFFEERGGFEGFLGVNGGDDDLLVNKSATGSNTVLVMENGALVQSKPKVTWKEYFNQKRRHLSVGRYYKTSDKIILGFFMSTQILTWFLAIFLVISGYDIFIILLGLGARWWFLLLAIDSLLKRTGEQFEMGQVFFLDFVFSLYYLSAGFAGLFLKNNQWK